MRKNLLLCNLFSFVAVFCFTILSLSLLTSFAFAQDVSTDAGLFQFILENVMNYKTMSTVAIALAISKSLLFAFNTPTFGKMLDKLTGKMKLLVTFALTYVVAVLTTMVVKDVSWAVALFDSANIPLLGLLLNQVYKQFVEKAAEAPKALA